MLCNPTPKSQGAAQRRPPNERTWARRHTDWDLSKNMNNRGFGFPDFETGETGKRDGISPR
jgi:hypothetical protein